MIPTDEGFQSLLNRIRGGEVDPGQARKRIEADLTPLVRRVLRTGYGPPAVVRWIGHARASLAPTLAVLSDEHASRYLGRLLCDAVLDRFATPARGTADACDTVTG